MNSLVQRAHECGRGGRNEGPAGAAVVRLAHEPLEVGGQTSFGRRSCSSWRNLCPGAWLTLVQCFFRDAAVARPALDTFLRRAPRPPHHLRACHRQAFQPNPHFRLSYDPSQLSHDFLCIVLDASSLSPRPCELIAVRLEPSEVVEERDRRRQEPESVVGKREGFEEREYARKPRWEICDVQIHQVRHHL